MRSTVLLIALILFSLLLPVSTTYADTQQNFNGQPPGLLQPPWVFSSTNYSVITGTVITNLSSYKPPNVFQFAVSKGTASASVSVNLNASSINIQADMVFSYLNNKSDIPPTDVIYIDVNNNLVYSERVNKLTVNAWTPIIGPISAYKNEEISFKIGLNVTNNQVPFDLWLDSINITGANVIVSLSNTYLNNILTGTWYNIYPYSSAYLTATYPSVITAPAGWTQSSSNSITLSPINNPDIYVPPTPELLTLHITKNYTITQIPAISNNFYIYPSNDVLSYVITINDLTGLFGPGSEVIISQGSTVVSSGYEDAAYTYSVWLPPGQYNLRIIGRGGQVYSEIINLGQTFNEISITIQNVKLTTSSVNSQISYGAGWSANYQDVVAYYTDPTGLTSSVTINLLYSNASGIYTLDSTTINNPTYAQVLFPANVNYSNNYLVSFVATTSFGTQTYGPVSLYGGKLFPAIFSVPTNIFGIAYIIPSSVTLLNVVVLCIMVISASVFGAKGSRAGFIVISFEGLLFWGAGWLTVSYAFLYTFALLAILAFLMYRRG